MGGALLSRFFVRQELAVSLKLNEQVTVLNAHREFVHAARGRTADIAAVGGECTAVARAVKIVLLIAPLHRAAKVRADGRKNTRASRSADNVESLVIIGERPTVAPCDSQRLSQRLAQIFEIIQRAEIGPRISAGLIEHREEGNANDRNCEQRSHNGATSSDEYIQKGAPRHLSRRNMFGHGHYSKRCRKKKQSVD